jgi:hypothetical protein
MIIYAAIIACCIFIWVCISDIRSIIRSGKQRNNVWTESEIRSIAFSSLVLGICSASMIYFVLVKVKLLF